MQAFSIFNNLTVLRSRVCAKISEFFNFVYLLFLIFHFRFFWTASSLGDWLDLGDVERSAAIGDGEAEGLADINL